MCGATFVDKKKTVENDAVDIAEIRGRLLMK